MNYYMNSLNNSYLAVHTDALCANVAAIEKTLSPGAEIIPVLKCDAYGLGLSLTAPALAALPGIRTFALAHVSEGLALRALGIEKDALILGNPLPHAVPDAVNAHLTLTAGRLGLLPALAAAAEAAQTEVKIQIKIDTGLHRVGVTPGDELEALLKELSAAGERIKLAGVYSHFADTAKPELCRAQAELLLRSAEQVERAGFAVPMRHICDSAGSEYYPEYHFDAVRLGGGSSWTTRRSRAGMCANAPRGAAVSWPSTAAMRGKSSATAGCIRSITTRMSPLSASATATGSISRSWRCTATFSCAESAGRCSRAAWISAWWT